MNEAVFSLIIYLLLVTTQGKSHQGQATPTKMTMTREQLKRGFLFISERMSWRDSYHETDSMAFAGTAKRLTCDGCGEIIAPGSLYSIGNRQVILSQ